MVLELLLERLSPSSILVISPPQPARPDWQESLLLAAADRGVESMEPSDVNGPLVIDTVRAHAADLLLSVYYTQLFRPPLLEAVTGPCLNFHPSLLPRHRGHAPIVWAIIEGDPVTGLSVHHVDAGIDTGALVYRRPLPIHPRDTGFQLHQKMAYLVRATAADLLRDYVLERPLPAGDDQVGAPSSHSRRDPQVNHIDWSLSAERIRNIVRALAPPLPGAFALFADAHVVVADVEVAAPTSGSARPPGMVEFDSDGRPMIWASDAPLRFALGSGTGRPTRAGPQSAPTGDSRRGAFLHDRAANHFRTALVRG